MTLRLLAVSAALLLAGSAAANDTMAELKTGGLSYVTSPDVEMSEEELFISPTEVRVDYVFTNASDKDVETYVAFPMPDITGGPDTNVALDDFETDNFLGFSVMQDSKPITPLLQQRISATGIDMTDVVTAQNIPLLPFSDATTKALDALPKDVHADFLARGLVFDNSFDAGNGWETHVTPMWTLHSAYYWKTTFPAKSTVKVAHRYKPSVGGTVALTFLEDGKPQGDIYQDYRKRFCIDDAFVKTAAKLQAASTASESNYYTESWISYILTTGNNWSGPIKRFKLTVDKGNPKNFVSFCGEGVKKTGPTTFEMTADDFSPAKDIDILLLRAPE